MEMDLLSSYDDDGSNNEQIAKDKPSSDPQSEWENFEKSLNYSGPRSTSDDISGSPKSGSSNHPVGDQPQQKIDDEDDESHLPPGVRRKNRCHSSGSSSSSEDERAKDKRKKDHSDSDMSTSDDSDASPRRVSEKKPEAKEEKPEAKEVKSLSKEDKHRSSKKHKHSRSSSGSRSRSRSPRKKRRESDDRRNSRRSRSRSRSRHYKKDKRRGSRRSRTRSKERRRSKERDHRRRYREKRRSRSRSRSRERRASERERRSSRDRSRRSRSKERRNRSPSPRPAKVIKFGDRVIKAGASFGRPPPSKPLTFKEKMRQQLIKAIEEGGSVAQAFSSKEGAAIVTQTAGTQQIPAPKKAPVPLMANLVTSTAGLNPTSITAAEAAMQSMLALQKETTEKTGVEIPKYYNPAAINPVKYAEQVQKRKLLWSKTKEKEVNSQWHATTLSSDHDQQSKEKFRKLMGIKQEDGGSVGEEEEKASEELEMKQRELFDHLDKEYQYARMATHTHRGVGLGFGSGAGNFHTPPS